MDGRLPLPENTENAERKLGDIAAAAGIRSVHVLAWRDLADVEAGGSEIHAAEIMKRWAAAGLDVVTRTSYAQGSPPEAVRDGYRVIRKAGRYLVFPRAALSEMLGKHGERDALVEIWNGVPFFSPLWARKPRVVFLHHHHEHMWPLVLGPNLAKFGQFLESRLAPRIYRRTRIVTLSESSKRELVKSMGFKAKRISVVAPGIDAKFSPGGEKSSRPLVVSVGRLMPSKRFDELIRIMCEVRTNVPDLELVIVGEGYEHDNLSALIRDLDVSDWVLLAGRVDDDELVDLYRSAWTVASASISEGWGMTLTEAAACGTPAVATAIPGHADAVRDGVTGLLSADAKELAENLTRVLTDSDLRSRLAAGALDYASTLTWDATALGALEALAAEVPRFR